MSSAGSKTTKERGKRKNAEKWVFDVLRTLAASYTQKVKTVKGLYYVTLKGVGERGSI